jgi:hypothetical protein|tara:strand:- start:1668 stop:1928 length:261 start_codon:yes stop_codon:yes gene_type:complete
MKNFKKIKDHKVTKLEDKVIEGKVRKVPMMKNKKPVEVDIVEAEYEYEGLDEQGKKATYKGTIVMTAKEFAESKKQNKLVHEKDIK